MASILKVDELRGIAAADDITITDGSATFKLQSGVAKVLSGFNQHASTTYFGLTNNQSSSESINVSSYTDVSTGIYEINLTDNFTNTQYITLASAIGTNNLSCHDASQSSTTAKARIRTTDADSNGAQDNMSYCGILGELA